MTAIKDRKTRLAFTTEECARHKGSQLRRIVIEVNDAGYGGNVRLEGTSTRFPISFHSIWERAVKAQVDAERAERKTKKAKKAAKKVRR